MHEGSSDHHSEGKAEEHRLVEQAQAGDRDAAQLLWRMNRRWVAAIVLAHRPRTIDVDDLMQDVAVRLLAKIDTLRDTKAFKPWLRQIIINICRGAARSEKPTLRLVNNPNDPDEPRSMLEPAGDLPEPEELLGRKDAAGLLLRQAMSLPAEYREPLLLRCIQSLTYQQISDILDLPITTIETRLARARKMLREEVGDEVRHGI